MLMVSINGVPQESTCDPRMAMDSDLLGQGMCSRWRKGEAPAGDFQWASHFKVVPQQVGKTDQTAGDERER